MPCARSTPTSRCTPSGIIRPEPGSATRAFALIICCAIRSPPTACAPLESIAGRAARRKRATMHRPGSSWPRRAMRFDLREARWLGTKRVQGYARVLAIIFAPTLIWFYLQAMGPTGSDFLVFWSSAKLTLSGSPAAAYDAAAQAQVQAQFIRTSGFALLNPPPILLLLLPFGLMPYAWAWPAWVGATYCIWLLAARRLIPNATWPIAVFPGAMMAAWHGQNGLVTAALFIGAMLSFRSARPILAGMLLGALIIKPHLAVLVPVALIAGREWKAL